MLTKEAEEQHHSPHLPSVLVRCVGGRDGGQTQTFHLIGLLSEESKLSRSSALMNRAHESEQHLANVSSIIELIQSIQSSGSVPTERTEGAPSVQWNVSANEVAQFVLANVSVGQHYDLIIYADNLIGRSAPLLYRNLLLLNGKPLFLPHCQYQLSHVKLISLLHFLCIFLLILVPTDAVLKGLAVRLAKMYSSLSICVFSTLDTSKLYRDPFFAFSSFSPHFFPHIFPFTDSVVNQANVATAPSRPNWAYLRFKGLLLVLFLLLIMAMIGLTIRSYLFSVSSYERGTHSPDNGK